MKTNDRAGARCGEATPAARPLAVTTTKVTGRPVRRWRTGTRLRNDEALDRLAGHFGDHLEVLVEVEDGQPG